MSERTPIQTDAAPAALGPYSQAIRGGGLVFTAGQVGLDPQTGELAVGVVAQAEQALANLAAILGAAGSTLDRTLKTTIFLAYMGDVAAVNEAYARHFSEPYPARSTVAVKQLPRNALVEIECVALDHAS